LIILKELEHKTKYMKDSEWKLSSNNFELIEKYNWRELSLTNWSGEVSPVSPRPLQEKSRWKRKNSFQFTFAFSCVSSCQWIHPSFLSAPWILKGRGWVSFVRMFHIFSTCHIIAAPIFYLQTWFAGIEIQLSTTLPPWMPLWPRISTKNRTKIPTQIKNCTFNYWLSRCIIKIKKWVIRKVKKLNILALVIYHVANWIFLVK